MKNKAFGLDIGAATMKAVWLSSEKDGYLLNAVLKANTPVKGIMSGSVLDQQDMASAIKKVVEDAEIDTNYVNLALPETLVYTKVIDMPPLSDKELSSAIYWEAEQQIPVPLNTITLDYTVLSRPEKTQSGQTMKVLLVGAPISLVERYEKIIGMAGLTIASIETEVLAVIRAIVTEKNFPTSLIVHIGTVNTLLTIIKNGSMVFTYSVPTGGLALSRAIASDFGFSMIQAEEYKKVYGLSESTFGGKIGMVTEPILLSIVSEIKKAFAYYNETYKEDVIKQILLSGGTAKLPGLAGFFTKHTSIETAIVNPWNRLLDQDVPKEIIDDAPGYTIAVGLAIREYE